MIAVLTPMACVGAIVLMCLLARVRLPKALATSREGAKLALDYLADWAKWMSGIQTASLGGLLLLAFHDGQTLVWRWSSFIVILAIVAACLAGWALLCSAWVLCSVPTLAQRIHAIEGDQLNESFDIYEQPLYRYLADKRPAFRIKVGYMIILQHWSWAVSLLLLGIVFVYAAIHVPLHP